MTDDRKERVIFWGFLALCAVTLKVVVADGNSAPPVARNALVVVWICVAVWSIWARWGRKRHVTKAR
jgi:hypothetical protein